MADDQSKNKGSSIPIIGFLLHRIKLLAKSRLFSTKEIDEFLERKKEQADRAEVPNLNILGQIRLSKPQLIVGHILAWYKIPIITGVVLSLAFGFYFGKYVNFVDKLNINIGLVLNLCVRTALLMIGMTPMVLIIALVAFLRTFEEEYDVIGDREYLLNAEELKEVAQALSWSQSDPEVEGTDWLRHLLEQLWPNLNIFLTHLIAFFCPNCSLDRLVGPINQLAKLEIKKMYLGGRVPKISGIHVVSRGVRREDLIIDCEFTYDSDIDFQITGDYMVDFGINWFYIKAKTRILLTPLFQSPPVVGKIQVSFLERPKIDWQFTGLLNILNWDFLKKIVQCVVSYFFENPRYFTINLAKELPVREMKLKEPTCLLRAEIMSAKYADRPNMPRVFGCLPACARQSDPYCKVVVEEQEMKTSVVENNSNPEWYEEFTFLVHESILNPITMTVLDEDMIEDQLIGEISIPINQFDEHNELNGREVTAPLTRHTDKDDTRKGRKAELSFRVSLFKLTTNIDKLKENLRLSRAQQPVASLSVLIDSAHGLDTCTTQVRSPELRPCVKISVGNQVRYTTCKRRTGFPVWEESHHFILYNPVLEMIHIEVIDMYYVEERQLLPFIPISVSTFGALADNLGLLDKGTVLGWYDVPTNDILISPKMKIEGSYRLNGFVENGAIRLLMAIRIAEFERHVSDNMRKQRIPLSTLMEEAKKAPEDKQKDHNLKTGEAQPKDKVILSSYKNPEEVTRMLLKGDLNKPVEKEMRDKAERKREKIKKEVKDNEEKDDDFDELAIK